MSHVWTTFSENIPLYTNTCTQTQALTHQPINTSNRYKQCTWTYKQACTHKRIFTSRYTQAMHTTQAHKHCVHIHKTMYTSIVYMYTKTCTRALCTYTQKHVHKHCVHIYKNMYTSIVYIYKNMYTNIVYIYTKACTQACVDKHKHIHTNNTHK